MLSYCALITCIDISNNVQQMINNEQVKDMVQQPTALNDPYISAAKQKHNMSRFVVSIIVFNPISRREE